MDQVVRVSSIERNPFLLSAFFVWAESMAAQSNGSKSSGDFDRRCGKAVVNVECVDLQLMYVLVGDHSKGVSATDVPLLRYLAPSQPRCFDTGQKAFCPVSLGHLFMASRIGPTLVVKTHP